MKTRNLVVLLIGIMLVSGLVAEENYTQLQERIDLLEAKLETINVEKNNNPYSSGEAFNWGTGWFGSAKTGTDYSMNFELGYMLKIKKPFASLTREYVGNRNDYRIGFSAVTIPIVVSRLRACICSFTVIPSTHCSRNVFMVLVSIF